MAEAAKKEAICLLATVDATGRKAVKRYTDSDEVTADVATLVSGGYSFVLRLGSMTPKTFSVLHRLPDSQDGSEVFSWL